MRYMQTTKAVGALGLAGLRPRPAVLPPPRRFLSRSRGPSWPVMLLVAISTMGSLGSLALCLAGHIAAGGEAFLASTLLILTLLLI